MQGVQIVQLSPERCVCFPFLVVPGNPVDTRSYFLLTICMFAESFIFCPLSPVLHAHANHILFYCCLPTTNGRPENPHQHLSLLYTERTQYSQILYHAMDCMEYYVH